MQITIANSMAVRESETSRLLGSGSALKVLQVLRDGPKSVSEVASDLSITDAAARTTLTSLRTAGLVERRQLKRGNRKPTAFYQTTRQVGLAVMPPAYTSDLLMNLLRGFGKEFGEERVADAAYRISRSMGRERIKSLLAKSPEKELRLEDFARLIVKSHGGDSLSGIVSTDKKGAIVMRDFGCPNKYLEHDVAGFFCDSVCRGFGDGMAESASRRFSVQRTKRADTDHGYCEFIYSEQTP
jgi:predicted ArsR family transcriptional regulator